MSFPKDFIPESAIVCLIIKKFASFQDQGKKLFSLKHVSTDGISEKTGNIYIFDGSGQLKRVKMEQWKEYHKKYFPEITENTYKQPKEGDWDLKFTYKKITIVRDGKLVNRWADSGKKKFLFHFKGDRLSTQNIPGDIRDALAQIISSAKSKITQGVNFCLGFPLYDNGMEEKWKNIVIELFRGNSLYKDISDIFKRKGNKIFNLRYFFIGKDKIEIYDRNLDKSDFFSNY